MQKAQQAKDKSEKDRLEYELEEKTKTPPTAVIKDINTAGQMYPYVIDINTGEQTPLEP